MAIDKLLHQNAIINKKVDKILVITEALEERMAQSDTNNNLDQTFVDVISL